MNRLSQGLTLSGLVVATCLRLSAAITLAPLFTDHAVLQQGKPVPIWGKADPGEHIDVSFSGQTASTTAAADGTWTAILPALTMATTGSDLVVKGTETVTLHDVLVGEVWLCSGQSNMEFVVWEPQNAFNFRVENGLAEVAAAKYPLIRHFKVGRAALDKPTDEAKGSWVVCSPETVPQFTAVGYFFARGIFQKTGAPVGIINSTWGGTPVEAWMSPAAVASSPDFAVIKTRYAQAVADRPKIEAEDEAALAKWNAEVTPLKNATTKKKAVIAADGTKHPKPSKHHPWDPEYSPSGLFNGMINPLLPYAIKGALWYQGESNADRAGEYHALFAAMITAWRSHFGQGDFPFYFVQLANYTPAGTSTTNWAFLREAQTQTLSLPNTGMAVAIDIGTPNGIHPPNKQEVGHRLSLLAMAELYGASSEAYGPTFASATAEGSLMRVRFANAGEGLIARDKPVQSLELAGADKKFYPATAKIAGDTLLVSSPFVTAPVAVRYAFHNAPVANLYNGAGLPAVPFRSDTW